MTKVVCPDCLEEVEKLELCDICESDLILNERYYLLKIIGHNIGVTYKALDKKTKNELVIKELSIKNIRDWKDEELFRREADTLISINNPQIPKFIDFFKIKLGRNIKYYTVMEFIYGKTLQEEMIKKDYSDDEVIDIIKEISKILDYLHSFTPPIIHRDIKPSNIIKRKHDKNYVLIDFGAVTDALKPQGNNTIAGTLGYMAPEQFMGKPCIESDYYSLGIIALELLTKRNPEELTIGFSLNWEELQISPYMKKVLTYFLEQDPKNRISSYKSLEEVLESSKISNTDLVSLDDINKIKEMYQELRDKNYQYNKIIKSLTSKFSIFWRIGVITILITLSIILHESVQTHYFIIPALLIWIDNIISNPNKKNDTYLKHYFSNLSEKEIVFLETLLKHKERELKIDKDYFYEIYKDAIDLEEISLDLIIEYQEQYKDIHKSI